ncbi:MAG: sigma factor-like helix-turn-helix DNA-binding protein [Ilumatobacteraceae bacterium]
MADVIVAKKQAADERDAFGILDSLLDILDNRERDIVLRVAIDGEAIIDVAADLGLARETVSRIYNRALRRIRDERGFAIAAYFGDDDIQPPC